MHLTTHHTRERCSAYLIFSVIVIAFSGFLYGYHTGVISGALIFLTPAFHLSIAGQSLIVSTILIGGLVGALFSGTLADRIGRRRTIAVTMLLFIAGALTISLSNSYESVLIGRFISGVGVGIVSMVAPLYLAEVSPPHYRGTFVSLYQVCLVLGTLLSFCANYFFAETGQWRWMFAIGIFPAVLQMFALFFLSETPAWLFSHNRDKEAVEALGRLRADKHWVSQVPETKATGHKGRAGKWKDLFSPKLRFILIVGFILGSLQQLTGVNGVVYFAPKIFGSAGIESAADAIIASICIGGINVLVTGLSAWFLDMLGRRILLLIGIAGMAVSLGFLSIAFFTQSIFIDKISLISLMAYIAFFAIGLGPVTWVILSEIYPLKVRGKALTVAIFLNWACNYLVSLTFLQFIHDLGPQGTFLIYAFISAAAFWFVYRFIPETRGKSLEEIEQLVIK